MTTPHDAVDAAVDANFERDQVPFFRALVLLPSHTHAPGDVATATAHVDALAAALGLAVERVPAAGGHFAEHRVYRTPALAQDAASLALVGHIDTVFPRELGFVEFTRDAPDSDSGGDIVRGPGVLDMKSGLSAIFFALRAVRDAAPAAWRRLAARVVMVSDEEVGSPTSRALFAELAPRLTSALVFEAGRDDDAIVTRRKGGATFTLTVHGRAAHAGLAHADGVNAIWALALLIPKIQAWTDYDRGVTLNVGLVSGGTAKNTVPDSAACVIDARFERVADAEAIVAQMHALAAAPFDADDAVPDALREVTVTVQGGVTRPPMEPTPATHALLQRYAGHAKAVGLGAGEAPLQGGGSDANLLAAAGVPCLDGLGPFGKHFHRTTEWSSLDSLRRRTQALARFLVDSAATRDTARPAPETP